MGRLVSLLHLLFCDYSKCSLRKVGDSFVFAYLGVEGRSKVVGEDTDVEKEGEVSDIHPEGCLGRFPVDMFAVREEIERCRRIRRHFCLLFVKSAEG